MIYLLIYSFIDIMNEKVRSKIVSLLKKTLQPTLQVLFQLSDNTCLCLLAGKYSALRSGLHSLIPPSTRRLLCFLVPTIISTSPTKAIRTIRTAGLVELPFLHLVAYSSLARRCFSAKGSWLRLGSSLRICPWDAFFYDS